MVLVRSTSRRGIYFIIYTICVALASVTFFCPSVPNTNHIPTTSEEHWILQQKQKMLKLEQQLQQQESNLEKLESRLRVAFPQQAQAIQDAVGWNMPTIYIITPTYARPHQKAELTRLKNTFLHIANLHWIIIEDSITKTKLVTNFLKESGLNYTHLHTVTPESYKMDTDDPNWLKPRGVAQRNMGLEWIRSNINHRKRRGVIYFADDDNTYDLRLFKEMRYTKKISVWPVGLVGNLWYERPLVQNGKVTGWYTYWKPERPFAMDMAGFALNIQLLFDHPDVKFQLRVKRGYQESTLLSGLVNMQDLEPLADNCTKVLVWHTRTERPNLKNEEKLQLQGQPGSDLAVEV